MGDRYFDLGNFAVNNELDEDHGGDPARGLLRRAPDARRRGDPAPDALHVGLPRGDVGGGPERGVGARLRLRRLRRRRTSSVCARRPPTRASSAGCERRVARGRELPDSARCVIVGGGVGGTSIAYHLAELGWEDVVLLERAQLTSGSTFHSAGLVGQLRGSVSLTKMMMHSVELYRRSASGVRVRPGLGRVRRDPARLEPGADGGAAPPGGLGQDLRPAARADLRRGGEGDVPADVHRRACSAAPGCRPTATSTPPSSPTRSPTARAGAACEILTSTRVTGIEVERGRVRARRDRARDGSRPRSWSTPPACTRPRSAGWPGCGCRWCRCLTSTSSPSPSASATERPPAHPARSRPARSTTARTAAAWSWAATSASAPAFLPDGDGRPRRDPEPTSTAACSRTTGTASPRSSRTRRRRVPVMDEITVTKLINGPEAFTPDNEFCLGETEVGGLFVAAGFCAHGLAGAGGIGKVMAEWIAEGEPGLDLWEMDVRRFGAQYRSPSYTHEADQGDLRDLLRHPLPQPRAQRGRPLRMSPAQPPGTASTAPPSARSPAGSGSTGTTSNERGRRRVAAPPRLGRAALVAGDRRRAPRDPGGRVAVFDESSFSKLEIAGPGAARPARAPVRQPGRARRRPDHLHADAQRPRRDRVRLHGRPARRGAVLDRHRDGVRQPRPRVDPQAPARRRRRRGRAT